MATYNPYAFRSYIQVEEAKNTTNDKVYTPLFILKTANGSKLIIATLLVVIVVMSFFLISATASSPNSTTPVEGEIETYVGSGDTLWNIAQRHYTDATDIGFIVYLIMERNELNNSIIMPGQQLILPVIS